MENTVHYDYIVKKLRTFFKERDFVEVPTSTRLSILAACEDPRTVTTYSIGNQLWPLPQSGQMWLEMELLKNRDMKGAFCIGPSYRNEPNIIPGRHKRVFPLCDFESHGSIDDLRAFETDLLVYLGFERPTQVLYEDACERYGVELIEAEQEARMAQDVSSSIMLERFPQRSNPYFVMKKRPDGLYNKIDVLLYGAETIGSSERSVNPQEMRDLFYTTSDGQFAELLFKNFGKDRVLKELDEYLNLNHMPRFGGGIGITRLERAMEFAGLLDMPKMLYPGWQSTAQISL
ncbi:MAG: amino acid--tRNA ligase-related protein [Candidatus Babeliales bacterium]